MAYFWAFSEKQTWDIFIFFIYRHLYDVCHLGSWSIVFIQVWHASATWVVFFLALKNCSCEEVVQPRPLRQTVWKLKHHSWAKSVSHGKRWAHYDEKKYSSSLDNWYMNVKEMLYHCAIYHKEDNFHAIYNPNIYIGHNIFYLPSWKIIHIPQSTHL